MDLLHHLEKGKEELSPLQYHIKSLHIISRHYKKSLLRSQIYHGYEELSTNTNYPIWRRQERRSKYAVQLASWQLRSNFPKTSVCLSVTPFWLCFHHVPIIVSSWNFQELLPWTAVMSMQKVKVRGQRSRSRSQRSTPNLAVFGL